MAKKKPLNTDSLYLDQLTFDPNLNRSFMAWIINNTRFLFVAILTLVITGVYSFVTLPRELNPTVNIPIVTVVTSLPGATSSDVEELITQNIEKELLNVESVDTMTSTSQDSVSVTTLQFVSTVDTDEALQDVKEKVDLVNDLPEDASTPRVTLLDFNDQPIWNIALVGEKDILALSEIAEELQDELEQVAGIRKVELAGAENEEIVIELNKNASGQYGIDFQTITQAISSNSVTFPLGEVVVNDLEYQVTINTTIQNIDQVRNLPIRTGYQTVPLSEIADVYYRSAELNQTVHYTADGKRVPAVQISVYKTTSETINGAVEKTEAVLETFTEKYDGITFESTLNLAEEVNKSFDDLSSNFASTIALVFVTLFLFLGFRQAFTAAFSIPLTFLSAFIIMSVSGTSLNFLSLFSLLLALGLVVDDAIVIVQASSQYRKKFTARETGLLVFRDFVVPIWTTTLTTVWAFLPLLLATGILGEFIKTIPIVVSATLISSTTIAVLINLPLTVLLDGLKLPARVTNLLIALGVIGILALGWSIGAESPVQLPIFALTAVLLSILFITRKQLLASTRQGFKTVQTKVEKNKTWKSTIGPWFSRTDKNIIQHGVIDFAPVARRYGNLLRDVITSPMRRRWVYGTSVLFFIIAVAFAGTGLLKNEFFPKTDLNTLTVGIEGPAGWTSVQTEQVTQNVEARLTEYPEVKFFTTVIGPTSNEARITLSLYEPEERTRTSLELAEVLRQEFESMNDADVQIQESSDGPPAGADLQVNIKGNDLTVLEQIVNDFQAILNEMPEAVNVDSSLKLSPGQINIDVNTLAVQERGLSVVQVASFLRTAIAGSEATTITAGRDELSVQLHLQEQAASIDQIQNMQIQSPTGPVSISEIAQITLEPSPLQIERENGIRVVRVTAAANQVGAPQLLQLFEQKTAEYDMPTGYTWDVGGANEENARSTQSIIQAMGISVILILITMVLQLNSFRKSFMVLLIIPLAVAGVFFNFTLFNIPLSFPALIGVLALFGIVVNNTIMLMEKINQNIAAGLDFVEAIVDACASRIEAIFFTSLTTTMGLLPITISDPLWRGLGGAIIAGLSVSGILILFVLPSVYYDVFKKSEGRHAQLAKNSR